MAWSKSRHSESAVAVALKAAAREGSKHAAAVGIWVVWLRGGRILECEWCARLDVEATTSPCVGAEDVVVIAVAPHRVEHPVISRATVLGEYLESNGFRTHTVHVHAVRDGLIWTSLRGRARSGIVPAPRVSPHRPKSRRLGVAAPAPKLLVAWCAAVAALVFTAPAMAAPPSGQPGLIIEPHSGGQAGVTAPPRTAAPATATPDDSSASAVEVSSDSSSDPRSVPATSVTPQAAPPSGKSTGSAEAVAEPTPGVADADTVRLGVVELPRPDWMSTPIAARERDWNAFLSNQSAAVLRQGGVASSDLVSVLGTAGDEQVPEPQELVAAQLVAADPQMLAPVAVEVVEPLVSEAVELPPAGAPQTDDAVSAVLALLPAA